MEPAFKEHTLKGERQTLRQIIRQYDVKNNGDTDMDGIYRWSTVNRAFKSVGRVLKSLYSR